MLSTIILTAALQAGPVGNFNYIRIGNVDGFGYVTGTNPCGSEPCWPFGSYLPVDGVCSANQLLNADGNPINNDGANILGNGDHLPDLNCDGQTRYGSDEFDLRDSFDLSNGTEVDGATDLGSIGSGWTDVAVSGTGLGWNDCMNAPTSGSFICNGGQPGFVFDFEVTNGDPTQPLYVNVVFADYDVDHASDTLTYTTGTGATFNTVIATQDNSTGDDGLIQEATAVIPFDDVFPDWSIGDYSGYLAVDFYMPSEPFVAYDYVELSVTALVDPEGCCCYESDGVWYHLEMTEDKCDDAGGIYSGDGVPCEGEEPDYGACCVTDEDGVEHCYETWSCQCHLDGGTFYPNAPCIQIPCGSQDPTGCCCYQKAGSIFWALTVMTNSECLDLGGYYLGDGTECEGDMSPMGACCFESASGPFCVETSECECDFQGGDFYPGLICDDIQCGPTDKPGACCYINLETGCYECIMVSSEEECNSLPIFYQFPLWQGVGTDCADPDITCCRQLGACCIDNSCVMTIREACWDAGGTAWSIFTVCDATTCPSCTGDVNGDGTVNILDLLSVIANWGGCL